MVLLLLSFYSVLTVCGYWFTDDVDMKWFDDYTYIYCFEMMIFNTVLGDTPSSVWYLM